MLIDCGEGTQRQLLRSTIGLMELPEVFLTHYHADHYLGLPGMLKTFALRGREMPLTVHGPPGLKDLFGGLQRIFGKLTYPVELVELRDGDVLDRGEYRVLAFRVSHGIAANGYAFAELPRPGSVRPRGSACAGRAGRAAVRAAPGRRDRRAPGRGRGARGPGPRAAAARAHGRRHRRHGPRRERARDRARGRPARPRSHLRGGGARARRGNAPLHGRRRCRARAGRTRAHARADAPLQPLLRPGDRPRGPRGLPRDGRSKGLRYHRGSVPGTGWAPTRQGRSADCARGGGATWGAWCRWRWPGI